MVKGEWQGPFTLEQTINNLFHQNKKLGRVRIQSYIWAAKDRACPTCPAEPYQQCMNMTDIQAAKASIAWGLKKSDRVRVNKWPHSDRVDWERLYNALIERGYIDEGQAEVPLEDQAVPSPAKGGQKAPAERLRGSSIDGAPYRQD